MLAGERTILERAQKGDVEAFEKIYDFYVPKIFRFVFLKIGEKELAEDITSETFIKFWKYIQGNNLHRESAEPILYKIARNLVIDFYRKKELITESLDSEMIEVISDKSMNYLERMINREEVEEMMRSLKQIRDEYQEIIILRFVEDLTIEEISQITGKSAGSVRVLSHRALKALENVMRFRSNGRA
jgi:RNA polymerase sigma-70 factor (ECF subfamily)